jgi:hypothetical protein
MVDIYSRSACAPKSDAIARVIVATALLSLFACSDAGPLPGSEGAGKGESAGTADSGKGGAGGTEAMSSVTSGTGGELAASGGSSMGGIASSGVSRDGGGSGTAGGSAPRDAAGSGSGVALAFPGALGFGRNASGGRGGAVYHVKTLDDAGPGSFRDAVSQSHRIVIFDVGGYVNLSSAVSVKSDITIAGQTAPGDGIGFMGREVSFASSSNVIVRYVRFRQGDLDPDDQKSGINLLDAHDMIFDHVSIEFAQWNNIDAVRAANVTIEYSIDADPIGQQFAAHTEGGPFTWYGNLFANSHNRCPLAKANTQYVNNVVYDFQAGYTAGNSAGVFSHDIVGSYFVTGPRTTSASNAFFQVNNQLMFTSGNYLDSNADGVLNGTIMGKPGGAVALSAPWSVATAALPARSAADAYADVVSHAGASIHRDQVDTLVVADLTSLGKSGDLWTSQTKTGLGNSGYGALNGGIAPVDSDGDGMPDAWETRHGLAPGDPSDARGDFDHKGYDNIEKYINGLADGSYP